MKNKTQHLQTVAIHAGQNRSQHLHDVIQPIHLSTTYERNHDGTFSDYNYIRGGNPNRTALEAKIAAIEGASIAIAFSSGVAAINAIFASMLEPGSHVIIPDDCYHGTRALLENIFIRWQVSFDIADMTDPANIARLIKKSTCLIWMETPSNPRLKITDIEAVTALAKKTDCLLLQTIPLPRLYYKSSWIWALTMLCILLPNTSAVIRIYWEEL